MGLVVRSVRPCLLVLLACLGLAAPASSQDVSAVAFVSQAGDFVGIGQSQTYRAEDGFIVSVRRQGFSGGENVLTGDVHNASSSVQWTFTFAAAGRVPLIAGTVYEGARRYPFTTLNALDVSGSGRGCNVLSGRFIVYELEFSADGTVARFAADFEQHCEDRIPGLFGAIRFHSTIASLTPFGGNFPTYSVTVPQPTGGNVTAGGLLNCGTGRATCSALLADPQTLTLTAAPDPGYLFAGWSGDCKGGATTALVVHSARHCSARFELVVPAEPRTLTVVDSRPGDFFGGKTNVYSTDNSRVSATVDQQRQTLKLEIVAFNGISESTFRATVAAPTGQLLGVWTYLGAIDQGGVSPGQLLPGLSVVVDSAACTTFGRFEIKELVVDGSGTVQRAAVDLENHCQAADAALFAAIRYQSTIVDPVPFGGNYPRYQLSIAAPLHGTISATDAGVACGTGSNACVYEPVTPVDATLVATPDPGYVFAGWTGECSGDRAAKIRVNSVRACSAFFEPIVAAGDRTLVFVDNAPGARGTGSAASNEGYAPGGSGISAFWFHGEAVDVDVKFFKSPGSLTTRTFSFAAPRGQTLQVGVSYPATGANATAGAKLSTEQGCSRLTGRFVVRELVVVNSAVAKLAIDYEQHCNDRTEASFGAVRYNSSLSALPFDGQYPRYRIVVTPDANGRVTGGGLDCGPTATVCAVEFDQAQHAALTATPKNGYAFFGWAGACHGGETIDLNVNGVRECRPLFQPASAASLTRLTAVGKPGNAILDGRQEIYSPANSLFLGTGDGSHARFDVTGLGDGAESTWSLEFTAPQGDVLRVGTYENVGSAFTTAAARLQLFANNVFCSVVASRFTVRQYDVDPAFSRLSSAAIDFEIHCGNATSAPLTGSILYESSASLVPPTLDKSGLSFAAVIAPGGAISSVTSAQTVRLSQMGTAAWTAVPSAPWITVTPASGSGSATLTVNVVPGAATAGLNQGTVQVTVGGTALAPLNVSLKVLSLVTNPPVGRLETPATNTQNLSGAVAVTGWAVDDIEVTDVQIWRQPHPSDAPAAIFQGAGPANGKVFIGNATFIDGARPDVEAAFPTNPNRSRAGWGYMMLTRGLVWDGQGPFTLYAIAVDREGLAAQIGSAVVSVNNALSLQPFGTIDTPGQGATASGLYPNTGWVMTPDVTGATTIPAANVRLMIDGTLLPGVFSTAPRADISASFPGMDTSQAGRGMFIDTTAFADGMHTIAWIVTDSAGHGDGIGSRFFRVANGGGSSLRAAERAAARPVGTVSAEDVDAAPLAMSAVQVRQGFDSETPFETLQGSSDGFAVTTEELERVEVKLPAPTGVSYAGYLRALGELRPLPAGAAFNPLTGTFTWQPPAGFIGDYDFVFVATARNGIVSRQEVRVTIRPRTK